MDHSQSLSFSFSSNVDADFFSKALYYGVTVRTELFICQTNICCSQCLQRPIPLSPLLGGMKIKPKAVLRNSLKNNRNGLHASLARPGRKSTTWTSNKAERKLSIQTAKREERYYRD